MSGGDVRTIAATPWSELRSVLREIKENGQRESEPVYRARLDQAIHLTHVIEEELGSAEGA